MMQRRRGYSLIEMLAVITMTSAILALATMSIGLIMRSERTGRNFLVATQTSQRMARQFRNDVHSAQTATVTPDKQRRSSLTLKSPGRPTVTWSQVTVGLRRTVDSTPVQVETYRVSPQAVSFHINPSATRPQARRLISLVTTPPAIPTNKATTTWPARITAALRPEAAP